MCHPSKPTGNIGPTALVLNEAYAHSSIDHGDAHNMESEGSRAGGEWTPAASAQVPDSIPSFPPQQ